MTLKEVIKNKILGIGDGLVKLGEKPDDDRLLFINDEDRLVRAKIKEFNLWYEGDGAQLLNYYTKQVMMDYNFDPIYYRNMKDYFWSVSSTEQDLKRTHSGQPRNIVDTLTNIIRFPLIRAGRLEDDENPVNVRMQEIIKESKMKDLFKQEQLPLCLVEGWGAYKINWDMDISDYPIPVYYRAENVDFIYKMGKIVGGIFRDYYSNGKDKRYVLVETRRLKFVPGEGRMLIIEKELYRIQGQVSVDEEYLTKVDFSEVPQLSDTVNYIEIGPVKKTMFFVPCILFKNTDKSNAYGRSIFTGKIELFDDLDQCLSQAANSVRKSTPVEYFNSDYLERDSEGLPKQPHAYDRKYSLYRGQKNADGSSTGDPVQVTQPQVNFQQYSDHAVAILEEIINGVMSPATIGIDIAKKDNAEAQREKEKVTIFTRNAIIDSQEDIDKELCSQCLTAYEFMHSGVITCEDYDISVKFSEFADDSYENKLEKLGAAFDAENLSEEMFMSKLYGDTLSRAEYNKELDWLKEHHTQPRDDGMQGIAGGGQNSEGLLDNMMGGDDSGDEQI